MFELKDERKLVMMGTWEKLLDALSWCMPIKIVLVASCYRQCRI